MLAVQDNAEAGDEVFGFHAQQAVEKALKAWLSSLGVSYPFSHSLGSLFGLIEDEIGAADINPFMELRSLGPFAVQFRYTPYEDAEEELDKDGIVSDVDKLLRHVDGIVGEAQ